MKKFKTVEEAVAAIRKKGFFITSVTELTRDVWSACLRPAGATTTSYAQGNTMLEALQGAYDSRSKEDAWNRKMPEKGKIEKKSVKKKPVKRAKLGKGFL